jgi:hypothetical protein
LKRSIFRDGCLVWRLRLVQVSVDWAGVGLRG